MKTYHITGRISWLEVCCCEFCDGHEKGRNVDVKLQAENQGEAEGLLLDKIGLRRADDYDWDDLKFSELTDAQSQRLAEYEVKRRLGQAVAPTLFELDEVTHVT